MRRCFSWVILSHESFLHFVGGGMVLAVSNQLKFASVIMREGGIPIQRFTHQVVPSGPFGVKKNGRNAILTES